MLSFVLRVRHTPLLFKLDITRLDLIERLEIIVPHVILVVIVSMVLLMIAQLVDLVQ